MTNKELKNIKHSLKTDVDRASTWMTLAEIGVKVGAEEDPSTLQTRQTVINELKKCREKISSNCNQFLAEIDRCIEKMS